MAEVYLQLIVQMKMLKLRERWSAKLRTVKYRIIL